MLALLLPVCAGWVLDSPTYRYVYTREEGYERTDNSVNPAVTTPWAGPESFNLSEVVTRWSLPADPYTDDELGSGISWAIHPSFCDDLLPIFPEENAAGAWKLLLPQFLNCDDLRMAVTTAFQTWSNNHPKIYFTDVTDRCPTVDSLNSAGRCEAAEVFIFPDNAYAEENGLAAYVQLSHANINYHPYLTSGPQLIGDRNSGLGIRSAVMHVRATDICWYLDSTFCYHFHKMNESGFDVILVMRLVVAALCVLSGIVLAQTLCKIVCKVYHGVLRKGKKPRRAGGGTTRDLNNPMSSVHDEAPEGRCTELLDYLAKLNICSMMLPLFWLIFTPIFYFRVFLPCWDCFDFEATMAHEIGHVLGFNHPDTFVGANLRATADMDASTCLSPLQHVALAPFPEESDSIMFSVSKHRDRTCLTEDDVQGLHFLYPLCEGATSEPNCIKPRITSGYLRLIISVSIPWLFISTLIFAILAIVRCHQARRVKQLEQTVANVRERGRILTDFLYSMGTSGGGLGGAGGGGAGGGGGRGMSPRGMLSRGASRGSLSRENSRSRGNSAAPGGGGGGGGGGGRVTWGRQLSNGVLGGIARLRDDGGRSRGASGAAAPGEAAAEERERLSHVSEAPHSHSHSTSNSRDRDRDTSHSGVEWQHRSSGSGGVSLVTVTTGAEAGAGGGGNPPGRPRTDSEDERELEAAIAASLAASPVASISLGGGPGGATEDFPAELCRLSSSASEADGRAASARVSRMGQLPSDRATAPGVIHEVTNEMSREMDDAELAAAMAASLADSERNGGGGTLARVSISNAWGSDSPRERSSPTERSVTAGDAAGATRASPTHSLSGGPLGNRSRGISASGPRASPAHSMTRPSPATSTASSCGARSGPAPPGYANDPLRSSSFVDGDGGGGLYPHPDSMRPSISDGVGSPGRGSPDRGPRLSEAERRRSSFNAYI